MHIPKYVADILHRAKFTFGKGCVPGYTIAIEKRTEYAYHTTLRDEAFKLVAWANREYQKRSKDNTEIAAVLSWEHRTRHRQQTAIVTIYDPIMKDIESYIGGANQ